MLSKRNLPAFLFLTTGLLWNTKTLCGQDSVNTINKINISSPTASSLGKYGDIPVSYNTGVPQISIPIYTIKSKSLTLPISLSYHASGLKVQEMASWVGAGWSLNAGGVITRSVVGIPDDKGTGPTYFLNGHYSDYGFDNYLFVAGTTPGVTTDGKVADDERFIDGLKDGQPDLFFFNFGAYSGKFYFNDDRTPILVPEQDFRIATDFTLGTGFTGFVITTPEGNKHYFGKSGNNGSVNPLETSVPFTFHEGPMFGQKAVSSWFLNKIVSADATDSLLFDYQAESYSYYTLSMYPMSGYQQPQFGAPAKHGYNLVKNLVDGVRLTKIVFTNGTVTFTPSPEPRTDLVKGWPTIINDGQANATSYSLGSIQISNGPGFCKQYMFDYSYTVDNLNPLQGPILGSTSFSNINTDRYKLRLDTLQEIACDGLVQVPPYIFNYYGELVPRTLSMGIDHWGYYNGVTNNTTLIPAHTVKFQSLITNKVGGNREAAFPAMRGGALQRITYPTGGYNEFEYEPNSVYVNYNTYSVTQPLSLSVGWGGSSGSIQEPLTFSGNKYQLIVENGGAHSNPSTSSVAQAHIYNSSNSLIFNSGNVAPGATDSFTLALPAGNYTVYLNREGAETGKGAKLFLNEHSPTPVSGNQIVGGLRIKTLTANDGITAKQMVTSYSYKVGNNPAGQSSGILYSKPDYVKIVKNKMMGLVSGQNCMAIVKAGDPGLAANVADQYYKSPVSVRPMQTVQGYHIGYNEVYTSQAGNGYSVYRYYGSHYWDNKISDVCNRLVDWDNLCDPNVPETPAAPVEFEFMRGELKYEGHFNQAGQVLKDISYYPKYEQSVLFTPAHISTLANGAGLYTDYSLRSAKKVSDSTEETIYNPGVSGSVTTRKVTYFSSKYHNKPTQKAMLRSNGERLAANYSYAFDFLPSTCTSINDGLSSYLAAIHVDSVEYFKELDTCGQDFPNSVTQKEFCKLTETIQFRRNINLKRLSFIIVRRTNFTDATNTFKANHDNAKAGAGVDYKPLLEMQNLYMNPVVEVSSFSNNLLLKAGFTKYAFSASPSGHVYPSASEEINVATPSSSFVKAVVNANNIALVKDNRYTDFAGFKFDGGNLVEITARDGLTTSYIWAYNRALAVVKAEGVPYNTLKAAYDAVGGNLSSIRSQSSLSNAMLFTYEYLPLVGMTSETDPSLQSLKYEYDALGRLMRVRDKNDNILKQHDYRYKLVVQ